MAEQVLPPGFSSGKFPSELEELFGPAPDDIMGYRVTTHKDPKTQKTYYELEISQKGAYGDARFGYSSFGARWTKDESGKPVQYTPSREADAAEDEDGGGGGGGGRGGGGGGGGGGGSTLKTPEQIRAEEISAANQAERQSAYDLLYSQFKLYGLESLVEPLKGLITSGASAAEFTIKLRESEAYKKRFSANAQRVAKGLRSLSEAEYIQLEDQYQDVMRRYGLPETYYAKGELGKQEGFEKFLAGDVSPVELEDRISTAQKRVLNANPEVMSALKQFYPEISNSEILAYTLDPSNAIENIKRKVTNAEIGGAAIQSGLQTGLTRAEELRAAGVTKDTAQQGFGTIAGGLQRGSQLASIYGQDPYSQTTAETEVFGLSGAQEARKQRQKVTSLEKATFGGQTGITSSALVRDRAGGY
jgi:hypothetical protein